jgi:DNA-binding protein HU-beta
MAKKSSAPTKSDILAAISKDTGLSKKQVSGVFDSLGTVIKKSLKSHGLFTLPGLAKMKVVKKPATKAREGVNPFTGEKMVFKAKPASKEGPRDAAQEPQGHGELSRRDFRRGGTAPPRFPRLRRSSAANDTHSASPGGALRKKLQYAGA